jgi:hypothetical protein
MKTHPFLSTVAIVSILGASVAFAQTVPPPASTVRTDLSVNYSRGDYGLADDTEVYVTLLNTTYESPSWRLQAALPVLNIKGPATVVGNIGEGVTSAPGRPTNSSETGLGDVTLGAAYKFGPVAQGINLDFGARVKLPTADEDKGLGTGEFDTYVQADAYKKIGKIVPFGTLGYRFLGSNQTYRLKDGVFASGGIASPVTSTTTVGASLNWRERIVAGGDHATELMAFAMRTLDAQWRVQGYVLKGFTDASPDLGLGAMVGYQF